MVSWPCCFGPVVIQYIMTGACSLHGSLEAKTKDWGPSIPFNGTSLVTFLFFCGIEV
jgi:hypothetical protein